MLSTLVFSWTILPLWAVGMGAMLVAWHNRNQQQLQTAVVPIPIQQ